MFDMDYEFFTRFLNSGLNVMHVNEYFGAFRHHSESKTSKIQDVSKEEMQIVRDMYSGYVSILKYIPISYMNKFAMLYKGLMHIFSGRADYIFRSRFVFK